jgi:histone acetyltransferase 1
MATIDWTADANEALTLSLGGSSCTNLSITNALRVVRAEEDKQVLGGEEAYEEFHPTFTYPVCFCFMLHAVFRDTLLDLRRGRKDLWLPRLGN